MSPEDLRQLIEPPDLPAALAALLSQIPAGRVTSFGDLAEALGDLKAARWVATHLQELDPARIPLHRVVRRTGEIVGTQQLPLERRIARLKDEGVEIADARVNLACVGWSEFVGPQPLALLRALQLELAMRVSLTPFHDQPERIAGLDVSYRGDAVGVAAYTVVEAATGKLLFQETFTGAVRFPYIPGYLSFRELPLYLELMERVQRIDRLEPVVLVDGTGILHPRRAGIASLVGCLLGLTTVGVTKHLLYGKVVDEEEATSPILSENDTLLGWQLKRDSQKSRLFVSPGHGIDVEGAYRLVQSQMFGRRLPEPIYQADRLSRAAARS